MRRWLIGLPLLMLLSGCGGGGKSTYITVYPRWDWQQYDRIAVVPFQCIPGQKGAPEAALQATYMLEDMLAANGNFTVLSRDAIAAALAEQDLSQLADVADPSTVLPPGKIQIAQALIVGKLTQFHTDARREEKRRPVYAIDNKGRIRRDHRGRPIVVREEVVRYYHHEGTVAGSARVIDAATGKVVFSYNVPAITRDDSQRGSPPSASPEQLAIEAARELAVDCYAHIAPVRTKVKLNGDSLIVALDYYDGEYDKTKKISTALDNFLLVVRQLPKECDRNPFRIAIAPEEGRNIFEQEFVWTANNPVRGQSWQVPVALLKTSGAAKFSAKLYSGSGEEPILKRDFELESPKQN